MRSRSQIKSNQKEKMEMEKKKEEEEEEENDDGVETEGGVSIEFGEHGGERRWKESGTG